MYGPELASCGYTNGSGRDFVFSFSALKYLPMLNGFKGLGFKGLTTNERKSRKRAPEK